MPNMSSSSTPMQIGFGVPFSGPWATPANQVRIATRAEELGYNALWTFARLVYPVDSPNPHWQTAPRSVPEPIVSLAYLAAHTERIRLGVAVLNTPFYAPSMLAKQLIQLDIVSGGRIDIGLGTGWSEEEFTAIGLPMERRVGRTVEYLAVIREIWRNEISEFKGEFTELPRSLVLPRPVQPELPILLGGTSERALRRAGRIADGWVSPSFADLDKMGAAIRLVKASAEEAGRDPALVRIVCRGSTNIRPAGAADRAPLSGSLAEIRSDFDRMAEQGVTELFIDLNFDAMMAGQDTDPARSLEIAEEALEVLAPTAGSTP
jgi:probable F420-dependent oxidoreductase